VPVGCISECEIGTRKWMGKPEAAVVVAAAECTNNSDLD